MTQSLQVGGYSICIHLFWSIDSIISPIFQMISLSSLMIIRNLAKSWQLIDQSIEPGSKKVVFIGKPSADMPSPEKMLCWTSNFYRTWSRCCGGSRGGGVENASTTGGSLEWRSLSYETLSDAFCMLITFFCGWWGKTSSFRCLPNRLAQLGVCHEWSNLYGALHCPFTIPLRQEFLDPPVSLWPWPLTIWSQDTPCLKKTWCRTFCDNCINC